MSIENLTNDQIAVLTELAIHHGMYRHEQGTTEYEIYLNIATELLDETISRGNRWSKKLSGEFVMAQIKTVEEYESD